MDSKIFNNAIAKVIGPKYRWFMEGTGSSARPLRVYVRLNDLDSLYFTFDERYIKNISDQSLERVKEQIKRYISIIEQSTSTPIIKVETPPQEDRIDWSII